MRHRQLLQQFAIPALVNAIDGFSGAKIKHAVAVALYCALYLQTPLDTATLITSIKATVPQFVFRREALHRVASDRAGTLCKRAIIAIPGHIKGEDRSTDFETGSTQGYTRLIRPLLQFAL